MYPKAAGFTLLELLVVLAIIASASVAVVLSLRDSPQTRLQAEAERVIAVLEATRADARASNTAMRWRADDKGFQVHTLPAYGPPVHNMAWLHKGTQASPTDMLISPEPVQARSRLNLSHNSGASLSIATDGAAAFKVLP